jgi:hypothetical protein
VDRGSDGFGRIVGKWSLVKSESARSRAETLVADIAPILPVKWSPSGEWIAYNGQNGWRRLGGRSSNRPMYDEPLIAFAWSPPPPPPPPP